MLCIFAKIGVVFLVISFLVLFILSFKKLYFKLKQISSIQGQVSSIQGQVSSIQGQVSSIQGQMNDLKNKIAITENILKINREQKILNDSVQTLDFYNLHLINNRNFEIFYKTLDKLDALSISELQKLKEFFLSQIDIQQNPMYLAKAFDGLGMIHKLERFNADDIFKAIKNFSNSLELCYAQKTSILLLESILVGFDDKVDKKNYIDYFTGYKHNEIIGLKKLIELNIPEIKARANYRLSMIYKWGRASNKEEIIYNLELAVKYLQEARKYSNIQQENVLNIVLTINERYTKFLSVLIASALVNADLSSFYKFYIINYEYEPITARSQEKLLALKQIAHFSIEFINFPKNLMDNDFKKLIKYHNTRYFEIIMYRLYCGNLLNKLDKVLYLDADLLVLEDLSYFNTIDLDNHVFAGALDINAVGWLGGPDVLYNAKKMLGPFYINSGVLLMNLDKIRKDNLLKQFKELAIKNKESFVWSDQDIINRFPIYYISPKWNYLANYDDNFEKQDGINMKYWYIRHFGGSSIETLLSDKSGLYWQYFNLTPWKE